MSFDPELTRASIILFEKKATPTDFFSSRFQDNEPTNQTLITLDVVRDDEEIAEDVVPGTGAANFRKNEPFVSKEISPPEYNEAYFMHADSVAKRIAGANVFNPVDRRAIVAKMISKSMEKSQNRILRAKEIQAVQLLTTGIITLKNGVDIDYKMKASHKIDAVGAWSNAAANVLTDIEGAGDQNRLDGLNESDLLVMGQDAIRNFLATDQMEKQLNFRRASLIDIKAPTGASRSGGKFHGMVTVGPYTYQLWSYPQFFKDAAGAKVRYLDKDACIVMSSTAQMDTKWGALNRFADGNTLGASIANMGNPLATSEAKRFSPYAFLSEDGLGLKVGVRSRPVLIPTDIDSFSVIDTAP